MALRSAMLQPFRFISEDKDPCVKICRLACSLDYCSPPCSLDDCLKAPYPPPPPPPPPPEISRTHHHISLLVIIASVLSTVFLLFAYYAVIRRYWRRRRIAAAQSLPDQINTVHHEDHDEGQNSIHYIWYLTTPGLDESIIKSIAVVKYREGDGLIEGTECAVCLGEFREDESLRLLPKCKHAFHIPCIDTWLRSHVNCPLCRAIVASSAAGASSAGPSSSSSGLAEENQVGNSRRIADGSDRFASARSSLRPDELELEGDEGRRDAESAKDGSSPNLNRGFRVQSDLAHGYRSGEIGLERLTDDGEQQVRRSVSMDSSAAAMIVISMGNLLPVDSEGSSSSAAAKPSGMKRIVPKHGRNPSFFKLMGCYSKGSFLQRGPVAMKRSFSTGGKFLLSKHSRSRSGSSALPL